MIKFIDSEECKIIYIISITTVVFYLVGSKKSQQDLADFNLSRCIWGFEVYCRFNSEKTKNSKKRALALFG